MHQWPAVLLALGMSAGPALPGEDGATLRAQLRRTYPSLAYVDRYRRAYPAEVLGDDRLWSPKGRPPRLRTEADLVQALAGLQDQHVSLAGVQAGKSESLGVLFRTATDGSMVVWRIFDPSVTNLSEGDVVRAVGGVPTARWLTRAAAGTFGGNRRSRAAEAAYELGVGTRSVHRVAGLGPAVKLEVQTGTQAPRTLQLAYLPMPEARTVAMSEAVNRADLPDHFEAGGYRIGTLRLGAFAPQFDPIFARASEAAEMVPGTTEDQAMVAGFGAVTRAFLEKAEAISRQADVLVLDLRGNLGGFGREARLLAAALAASPLPRSFDVFPSGTPGTLKLVPQPEDEAFGKLASPRPLVVLTDAGTRSAGEFMATWLWAAGAITIGERTIGAGGGREFNAQGFSLPKLGFQVRMSTNFTFFDASGTLQAGETPEGALLNLVARNGFAPDRARPFAIQAVGLRPDLETPTTLADLQDRGVGQVQRAVALLRQQKRLP